MPSRDSEVLEAYDCRLFDVVGLDALQNPRLGRKPRDLQIQDVSERLQLVSEERGPHEHPVLPGPAEPVFFVDLQLVVKSEPKIRN